MRGVASPWYTTNLPVPDGGCQPLTQGTYSIGFENVTDPDLCMLSNTTGSALVDVVDFPDAGGGSVTLVATALSGTVTLRVVGGGRVAGSFQVMMGAVTT